MGSCLQKTLPEPACLPVCLSFSEGCDRKVGGAYDLLTRPMLGLWLKYGCTGGSSGDSLGDARQRHPEEKWEEGCVIEQVKGVTEEASEEHPKLRTNGGVKTAERECGVAMSALRSQSGGAQVGPGWLCDVWL